MIALVVVLDAVTPEVASPPVPDPLTITVAPGVAWGYFTGENIANGAAPAITADVGYRTDEHAAVGAHLALSHLSGTYMLDTAGATAIHYDYNPIFLAAFARAETLDRFLWGEIALGIHVDAYRDQTGSAWDVGLGVALSGGIDLYRRDRDRFGLYASVESELQGQSYEALTLGIAYRR